MGEITSDRVTAQGFAESRPLAANDTPENRSKNRRVEITVRMDEDER
jgi:chemotaxis protein MotB